ncbi:hypothetical protein OM428_07175 [Enterococcus gallinarum]|nr:hypothetical protein [Enterococcus gallinarum]MCW3744709.1 hypothetical protein [Enterococcus gallinarum]
MKVSLSPVPFSVRLDRSNNGDFDVVMGGWGPTMQMPAALQICLLLEIPITVVVGVIQIMMQQ